MASDVTNRRPPAAELPAAAPPAPPPEPAAKPHWLRFYAIYVVLGAALFGAAVIGVLSATKTTSPGAAWSAWQPHGGGIGAAAEIAQHVGGEYRLDNGNQLVDVIAKAPSVTASNQSIRLGYVAVRGTGGKPDGVFPVSGSNSVMYNLCGLGTACTIATGKASVARGQLVRREILELALYTFHYEGGIGSVIAFMPPSSPSTSPVVVYLRRSDLGPQLRQPLAQTLDAQAPGPTTIPRREAQLVDATTGRRVYSFSLTQAQDGNAVLVLSRLAA